MAEMTELAELAGPRWASTKHGYALAQSVRQLKQHRLASLATLMVLGITLTLPALLYFVSPTLQALSMRSLEGESMTAYLSTSIDEAQGILLAKQWATIKGVERTRHISNTEALDLLRQNTDLSAAIDALEFNPLPGAIVVYPEQNSVDPDFFENLESTLSNLTEVDHVQFDHQWIKRLRAVISLIQWVGGLMAAFLLLTALLVITNTIRLETSRRRAEMQVAGLLGASGSFIRRPIIYSGVLYGLLGGCLASIFAWLTLTFMAVPADALSSMYNNAVLIEMPSPSHLITVIGVSVALGLAGSMATLLRPASSE